MKNPVSKTNEISPEYRITQQTIAPYRTLFFVSQNNLAHYYFILFTTLPGRQREAVPSGKNGVVLNIRLTKQGSHYHLVTVSCPDFANNSTATSKEPGANPLLWLDLDDFYNETAVSSQFTGGICGEILDGEHQEKEKSQATNVTCGPICPFFQTKRARDHKKNWCGAIP